MLKTKKFDSIVLVVGILTVVVTLLFMNGEMFCLEPLSQNPGYQERLFDQSMVHEIDIQIEEDDWNNLLENARDKEYHRANLVIDGELFKDVGIRTKGKNSLRLTERYGSQRYSLKIEMDHYGFNHYYGLDKFSLDSSFQDNSYLKSYLAYDMMQFMDVPSSLTSYTWVTVNGEDWGLFTTIEEPEEAFAQRNFGKDYGELYKPGYRSLEDENADVALRYINDDTESYPGIFDNAKFNPSAADEQRVVEALKVLSTGENLEKVIDIDALLRFFVPQVFVVNIDSYLGPTGHNYFLYENNGKITMLPWDYNLAFATYSLGMPNPVNNAELYVNYPIDTPWTGDVMLKRPLYHNVMSVNEYYQQYHDLFDYFIAEYFESGYFDELIVETALMIAPYVERDPNAFVSFEDHLLGVETIINFIQLRAQSIRKQLDGEIPSTLRGQNEESTNLIDASSVWLPDMGEIADLKDE